MKLILLATHDHSMACVVATLEANNDVVILCQKIDYLALTLIAKLCTGEYRKHGSWLDGLVDNNFDASPLPS